MSQTFEFLHVQFRWTYPAASQAPFRRPGVKTGTSKDETDAAWYSKSRFGLQERGNGVFVRKREEMRFSFSNSGIY